MLKHSMLHPRRMSPFLYSWLLPEKVTTEKQVTPCKETVSQQRSELRGLQGQNSSRWRKVLSAHYRDTGTLR